MSSSNKNAKRREKAREKKLNELVEGRKIHEEEETPKLDPVQAVKNQLANAKANGDHKLAAKLRQDLWVLQDVSSGHSLQLESEVVEESMHRLLKANQQSATTPSTTSTKSSTTPKTITKKQEENKREESDEPATTSSIEKDIKKLKKKLEQIDKLKKIKENGDALQQCQLEKLSKEESFRKELEDLQEQLEATR